VEVDETFIGGQEPGLSGGRAKGKKVLTGMLSGTVGAYGGGVFPALCALMMLAACPRGL
jgi:hypothetical protein